MTSLSCATSFHTQIKDETNILQDGTLIDLCGATLLWRSSEGLQNSPVCSFLVNQLLSYEVVLKFPFETSLEWMTF